MSTKAEDPHCITKLLSDVKNVLQGYDNAVTGGYFHTTHAMHCTDRKTHKIAEVVMVCVSNYQIQVSISLSIRE